MDLDNISRLKLLLSIEGIGPQKILNMLSKFSSFESILNSDFKQLLSVEGINKGLASKIIDSTKNFSLIREQTEIEYEKLSKLSAFIITYWDDNYPSLLRKIYFPPILLYGIGNFEEADKYSIAVIGTRQPTLYGKRMAENLTAELTSQGITIVSGLARGIDSIAHSSALKNNGRTIAVIGSGLDVVYPPENKNLFKRITENGIVITEYELGTKPDAQNFPRRNRIISGLSLGIIVVETRLNGGAMQTAEYALDQNREVFAVPGNLNSVKSEGPNTLIKRGEAKLIQTAKDVFDDLHIKLKPILKKENAAKHVELTLFEEKILKIIDTTPKHIDEIAADSSMSTADCLVNLLSLEFKGLVQQLPGKMFVQI